MSAVVGVGDLVSLTVLAYLPELIAWREGFAIR